MLSRLLLLTIITLLVSASSVYAHEHDEGSEYHHHDHDHDHGSNEYNMMFSGSSNSDDGGDTRRGIITPPSPFDKAATARWITHNTDWGTLSTITGSSRERPGSPFANIASHSDGSPSKSTGTVYFLKSPLDASIKDVMENNLVSFAISEMQTGYCQGKEYDAEDPRCARLSLNGRLVQVTKESDEMEVAKTAMFSRHPVMKTWYNGAAEDMHQFGFWKLDLEEIWLVDFFGGAALIDMDAWNRGTDKVDEKHSPCYIADRNNTRVRSQLESGKESLLGYPLSFYQVTSWLACALVTLGLGVAIGQYTSTKQGFMKVDQTLQVDPENVRPID